MQAHPELAEGPDTYCPSNMGMGSDGLVLKAARTGFLFLRLTTAPECRFEAVTLVCHGDPEAVAVARVNTGGADPAWPVGGPGLLQGRTVELTEVVRGAQCCTVRFDLRNRADERRTVVRRLEVRGRVG
ncbi:MAG: hypothetical protein AB1505_26500 [Candidatus Latescibacterota bacterium]